MDQEQLLEHLLDIKERLSVIETKGDILTDAMERHMAASSETREAVDEIKAELHQAKGSIKTLKWGVGLPAVILAALNVIKNLLGQ